ncbi:MAG: 50S ribosomal protein L11 methyltransferase [candidate division Zixibacteria bacterium]|nr:50S ribosomal protein L11 methyltransferase [candidate division Zixibacteria bacterium]
MTAIESPLHFVRLIVPSDHSDIVSDYLIGDLIEGVEIRDGGKSKIEVCFYLPRTETENTLEKLDQYYSEFFPGETQLEREIAEYDQRDWQKEYLKSARAVVVSENILVRPSWVPRTEVSGFSGDIVIIIDPGMAFGTGAHATTQLAMVVVYNSIRSGERVADIGCGSLILSILAAMRGASFVKAVDIDQLAVEISAENARTNSVNDKITIERGSTDLLLDDEPYDILVGNLLREIILVELDNMIKVTRPGGRLLLTGLLETDEEALEEALRARGVSEWSIVHQDEWILFDIVLPA